MGDPGNNQPENGMLRYGENEWFREKLRNSESVTYEDGNKRNEHFEMDVFEINIIGTDITLNISTIKNRKGHLIFSVLYAKYHSPKKP